MPQEELIAGLLDHHQKVLKLLWRLTLGRSSTLKIAFVEAFGTFGRATVSLWDRQYPWLKTLSKNFTRFILA